MVGGVCEKKKRKEKEKKKNNNLTARSCCQQKNTEKQFPQNFFSELSHDLRWLKSDRR